MLPDTFKTSKKYSKMPDIFDKARGYIWYKTGKRHAETSESSRYNKLPPYKGAQSAVRGSAMLISKKVKKDENIKKILEKLPFGTLTSVVKFSTVTKTSSPRVSANTADGDGIIDKFIGNDYRIKDIFPRQKLVKFSNGNVYFQEKSMVFEPKDEDSDARIYNINSKEANLVKQIIKIWYEYVWKDTKELYDQYKDVVHKSQLQKDHEDWKNGRTRIRPEGRIYEQLNEDSYFNY